MNAEELKIRTKKFALDVACLCADIPRVTETSNPRSQLQRCSSSVAANYRAACRGKSKADFIAKLGIVEEEPDESVFWLEFLGDLNRLRNLQFSSSQSDEWFENCGLNTLEHVMSRGNHLENIYLDRKDQEV